MTNSSTEATSEGVEANLRDIRPVIPRGSNSNLGLWTFMAVLLIGGVSLFGALNASREAAQAPSVLQPSGEPSSRITSPPPLGIPQRFADEPRASPEPVRRAGGTDPNTGERRSTQPRTTAASPPPSPVPQLQLPFVPRLEEPRVVFDNRGAPPTGLQQRDASRETGERVTAGRFRNPSLTVPQGTVVPAVLETALDSTRPGGVRALVQRDVLGFDGTRLLIPRGSRLYGEYEANLEPGQKRALVRWTRLIRPDGVTIALDSPSSDPLGRAGVRGKVDSKFLQRFGGAILQSVLDIGVGVAVSRATDGVIIGLPGALPNTRIAEPQQIQPTLKVAHGTSVSVFVARDLDFSTVEQ